MASKPVSNLAKNIQETLASLQKGNGITGLFTTGTAPTEGTYPDTPDTKDAINRLSPENWLKSFPYTFSVMQVDSDISLDGSNNENAKTENNKIFSDFALPINPSDINTSYPMQVIIKPTQGGTSVQHSGVKYGDLTISGTTGVHPNMGSGGASNLTGKAILQPDALKYRSGFEVYQRLYNWFAAYYHLKANNEVFNKKYHLVFKNFKDGEFLIVELLNFDKKRTSQSPHFYNYVLTFKIIGRKSVELSEGIDDFFSKTDSVISYALQTIDVAKGAFLRTQGILREVEGAYESTVLEGLRKATLACKAFTGIGLTASDMSKKAINSTLSAADTLRIALGIKEQQNQGKISGNVPTSITSLKLPRNLETAIQVQGAEFLLNLGFQNDLFMDLDSGYFPPQTLEAVAQEQIDAINLPRSYYEGIKEDLLRVADNAADKFGLGDSVYDRTFDRTNTSVVDVNNSPTDEEIELLSAFDQALLGLDMILSTTALFKSPYSKRIENFKALWEDGYPSAKASPAVKEITLDKDLDLERLAKRELGNADRWVEIVELNDLKPPYVVQDMSDTTPNVKRPGDTLLIPQPIINGFGTLPTVTDRYINSDLNAVERNLGIDLMLTPEFDIALSNNGDFKLIRGVQNAVQAIIFKFFIEKGELLDHPEIGLGIQIGTTGPNVTEIKTSLLQTLSVDPRFEKIENLDIVRVGSELRLQCIVTIRNVDTPIPVSVVL